MTTRANDAAFDTVLEMAFKDAFKIDAADLEKDLDKINCDSPKLKKYERIARRAYKKKQRGHDSLYYFVTRTAAAILIVFSLGCGIVLASPSVRAEISSEITGFFEKYFSFSFADDSIKNVKAGEFTFGYMPKGFVLINKVENSRMHLYTFQNDENGIIDFSYSSSDTLTPQYDNENADSTILEINGVYVYIISNNDSDWLSAVWNSSGYAHNIKTDLSLSQLKKIIEKIY